MLMNPLSLISEPVVTHLCQEAQAGPLWFAMQWLVAWCVARLFMEIFFLFLSCFFLAPEVPESCLPIGAKAEDGNTQVVPVELSEFGRERKNVCLLMGIV